MNKLSFPSTNVLNASPIIYGIETTIPAMIISEVPYKESSKIINVFTNEGIIGIIARGATRPKSHLASFTSKLTYGVFHINKRNNLSTLIEVDVIDNFGSSDLIVQIDEEHTTSLIFFIERVIL